MFHQETCCAGDTQSPSVRDLQVERVFTNFVGESASVFEAEAEIVAEFGIEAERYSRLVSGDLLERIGIKRIGPRSIGKSIADVILKIMGEFKAQAGNQAAPFFLNHVFDVDAQASGKSVAGRSVVLQIGSSRVFLCIGGEAAVNEIPSAIRRDNPFAQVQFIS